MKVLSGFSFGLIVVASAGGVACSKEPRAQTASSAGQGSYAIGYPDALTAARTQSVAIATQVDAATADFAHYPDALSNPSWPDVEMVYGDADQAGRSTAYVEEVEKDQVVAQFYIDEKDELNRRVGGAAQYAAKQKQCDVELSGPISYSLGKAFDERIRDRVRSHSEAFQYIGDHEDALGKKNRPKLEDQSDGISQASYYVNVSAPMVRERLVREVNEASDVDHTLQRIAEEAHRTATDATATAAQKSRASEREQAAIAARQKLAPEVNQSKQALDGMDKRIEAMRNKYNAAFAALKKDVENRARAAPATPAH